MNDSTLTAILIDDMELARASLRAELEDHCPYVRVIGEAEGVVSGAKLLREQTPDILFLDIEMDDGDGFDLLDIVGDKTMNVVFVTARQDFAIKAFQYSAFDYLLKPVDPDLLIKAIEKARETRPFANAQVDILKKGLLDDKPLERIALHTSEKIQVVRLKDIIRLESMANYTQFFFQDGTKTLITRTLKEYDKMLSDSGFIRVHQSHLINQSYIKAYMKTEGGYIKMTDDSIVPVSVRKKSYVVSLLG